MSIASNPLAQSKTITKAYKVRIYPNKSQNLKIEQTFGAKRFIFNYFLALNKEKLEKKEYKINYNDESKILTLLKQENEWLTQSDKFSLQNAIKDQDTAFKNLFEKRAKFPRFHSKRDVYQSYRTNLTNGNIEIKGRYIKLPKIGYVKFAKSQEMIGKILNVTISRSNNKYYASICVSTELTPKPIENNRCGIDLGLNSLMVIKDQNDNIKAIKNPKWLEKSLKNLKRKQQKLSRKQHSRFKGDTTSKSKRYIKQQKTVAKVQEKIANQRKDFLHKLSTQIIDENQAIGIEDLNVKGLMKNHKLSRHIAQSGWRLFRTMLEYKSQWHERELTVHDRFYPSSRLCTCGVKNKELNLSDRIWICKACGATHKRDELAAHNLIPKERGEFTPVESAMAGSEALY